MNQYGTSEASFRPVEVSVVGVARGRENPRNLTLGAGFPVYITRTHPSGAARDPCAPIAGAACLRAHPRRDDVRGPGAGAVISSKQDTRNEIAPLLDTGVGGVEAKRES